MRSEGFSATRSSSLRRRSATSPWAPRPSKRHAPARERDIYVAESGDPEFAGRRVHPRWGPERPDVAATPGSTCPRLPLPRARPSRLRTQQPAGEHLARGDGGPGRRAHRDTIPTGRAHVVGLSYGGSVVLALLDRHPDRIDRAVVDGSGVLSSWIDPLVVLGAEVVSPIAGTRPVATLLGPIGLRGLGIALRGASPAAMRRAFREGYTAPLTRMQLEANCPTLLVAGEKERTVRASNAAFAALMPHAVARFVPGLSHAWFAWRPELHMRMVETWLFGQELPSGLEPEPRSPEAVDRVLRLLAHPPCPGSTQPEHRLTSGGLRP